MLMSCRVALKFCYACISPDLLTNLSYSSLLAKVACDYASHRALDICLNWFMAFTGFNVNWNVGTSIISRSLLAMIT